MADKISCIVVEDDEVDKLVVLAYLESYAFIEISGAFNSPKIALEASRINPPDCLLLDIDMPEMSGMQLRSQLIHIPACIFITSYPDFALEGFELAALDFLVKPFSAERFGKAISRLQDYITLKRKI